MTREEKIIATAFTGKMFIDGSDMGLLYEYMEMKVGHGVIDIMLADKAFWEELHRACEQDFIDMVSKERPSLPSNLDEAAEEFASNAWLHGSVWHEAQRQTFKAGAEWMAGQGEIIEGEVVSTSTNDWECIRINKKLHSVGDKVTIQIRKK